MSDQQTAEQTPTPPTPPAEMPKVAIPVAVTAEIIRLHKELVNAAQIMEQKRSAFNELIRVARLVLGIPSNEVWDLLGDGSAFQKTPVPPIPPAPQAPATKVIADAGVAQSASPEATIAQ